MRDNPCQYCKDRTPECHGICVKYKEWREEYDEFMKGIREKERADRIARNDYHEHRCKRRLKGR